MSKQLKKNFSNFYFTKEKKTLQKKRNFVNAATLLAIKEHESSPDTKPPFRIVSMNTYTHKKKMINLKTIKDFFVEQNFFSLSIWELKLILIFRREIINCMNE